MGDTLSVTRASAMNPYKAEKLLNAANERIARLIRERHDQLLSLVHETLPPETLRNLVISIDVGPNQSPTYRLAHPTREGENGLSWCHNVMPSEIAWRFREQLIRSAQIKDEATIPAPSPVLQLVTTIDQNLREGVTVLGVVYEVLVPNVSFREHARHFNKQLDVEFGPRYLETGVPDWNLNKDHDIPYFFLDTYFVATKEEETRLVHVEDDEARTFFAQLADAHIAFTDFSSLLKGPVDRAALIRTAADFSWIKQPKLFDVRPSQWAELTKRLLPHANEAKKIDRFFDASIVCYDQVNNTFQLAPFINPTIGNDAALQTSRDLWTAWGHRKNAARKLMAHGRISGPTLSYLPTGEKAKAQQANLLKLLHLKEAFSAASAQHQLDIAIDIQNLSDKKRNSLYVRGEISASGEYAEHLVSSSTSPAGGLVKQVDCHIEYASLQTLSEKLRTLFPDQENEHRDITSAQADKLDALGDDQPVVQLVYRDHPEVELIHPVVRQKSLIFHTWLVAIVEGNVALVLEKLSDTSVFSLPDPSRFDTHFLFRYCAAFAQMPRLLLEHQKVTAKPKEKKEIRFVEIQINDSWGRSEHFKSWLLTLTDQITHLKAGRYFEQYDDCLALEKTVYQNVPTGAAGLIDFLESAPDEVRTARGVFLKDAETCMSDVMRALFMRPPLQIFLTQTNWKPAPSLRPFMSSTCSCSITATSTTPKCFWVKSDWHAIGSY